MKNDKLLNIVIVICVVILVAFFSVNKVIEDNNQNEYAKLSEEQNKQRELDKEKDAIVLNGGESKNFDKRK